MRKAEVVTIESLEDFKKFLISVNHENECFLSRGVSDEAYKFTSSVRYHRDEFPDSLSLEQIRDKMKTKTDGRLLNIRNNGLLYLENLSNLQHDTQGTFLSDYSFDPYTGLYFACKIQNGKYGKIAFIPSLDDRVFYTTPEDVKNGNFDYFVSNDSKINDDETIRLFKSRRINNKILYQSSIFAIDRGDLDIRVDKIVKYIVRIPDEKKQKISDDLKKERKYFRTFDIKFDGNNNRNMPKESSILVDVVSLSLLVNESIQGDEGRVYRESIDYLTKKEHKKLHEMVDKQKNNHHNAMKLIRGSSCLLRKSNDEVAQLEIINFPEKFNCQIPPYLLIAYYIDEMQYLKAMDVFNNIKFSNMDSMTAYSCGILCEKIGDYKNSIICYKNFIGICEGFRAAKHPYDDKLLSSAYYLLANILQEMNRNQEALEYIETSIQYHDTVEKRNFQGEVNKKIGFLDIAISNFNETKSMMLSTIAMSGGSYSAHPYRNIAACLMEEEKYLNVIAECYEFLWAQPCGEDVYCMLSISYAGLNAGAFHELSQYFGEKWDRYKGLIVEESCEEDFINNLHFHPTIEELEILKSLSDFVLETKNLYSESLNSDDNLFNEKSNDYKKIKNSFSYFGLGAMLLIDSFVDVAIDVDEELPSKQQEVIFASLDVEKLKMSVRNLEKACKIQPKNWVCVMNLEYAKSLLTHQSNGILNGNSIKLTISKYNSSINQKRREIFHKTWINHLGELVIDMYRSNNDSLNCNECKRIIELSIKGHDIGVIKQLHKHYLRSSIIEIIDEKLLTECVLSHNFDAIIFLHDIGCQMTGSRYCDKSLSEIAQNIDSDDFIQELKKIRPDIKT